MGVIWLLLCRVGFFDPVDECLVVDAVEDCKAGRTHAAGMIGFDDGGFLFGSVAKATEAVGFHDGFGHSGHNRRTMTSVMGLCEIHHMVVGTTLTCRCSAPLRFGQPFLLFRLLGCIGVGDTVEVRGI